MHVAGLISDQGNSGSRYGFVEIDYRKNIKGGVAEYLNSLAANYGGSPSDYSAYEVPSAEEETVSKYPDDFNLVWTSNEVTDLDYTPLTSLQILKLSLDKSSMLGDNTESANLTVTLYESDGVTPVTTFNDYVYIACNIDHRFVVLAVELTSGTETLNFKAIRGAHNTYGVAPKSTVNGFKIDAPVELLIHEVI